MKKTLLTGVAVLFLATGTAHAESFEAWHERYRQQEESFRLRESEQRLDRLESEQRLRELEQLNEEAYEDLMRALRGRQLQRERNQRRWDDAE